MPIMLDTPYNYSPGHGEADVPCNFVFITDFRFRSTSRLLTWTTQYGNFQGTDWNGQGELRSFRIENCPAEFAFNRGDPENPILTKEADPVFDQFVEDSLTSAAGVPIYDEVSKSLYQWLIDKGHYSGTIV